jgi:hypothetical protein
VGGITMSRICIITPTRARDFTQFSLLRRSIKCFAPGFPHIAIVNTEDYRTFSQRFAREDHLEIVKSSDVLPRSVEYRRRRSGIRRWLRKFRHMPFGVIGGWYAQQIMKLNALAECRYESAAFFDSDVFICRPIGLDYFHVGERLKLYRRPAPDAECMDFDISTHEIVGNPLHRVTQLYDYIYSPTCFRKSTAVRLFQELRAHGRSSWVRRFLAQRRPSEYHLLGYAATVLEGGAGYAPIECNPEDLHHSIRYEEDRAGLAAEIERMKAQPKDFALIQSSLSLTLEQCLEAFEAVAARGERT